MALVKGQLAASDVLGTGTLTDVYTVPVGKEADVNITVANRANLTTLIRIAHIKNDVAINVANEDYILFDIDTASLQSNLAPIRRNGILMQAGDTIAVYSSAQAVSAQVNGIEQDA